MPLPIVTTRGTIEIQQSLNGRGFSRHQPMNFYNAVKFLPAFWKTTDRRSFCAFYFIPVFADSPNT